MAGLIRYRRSGRRCTECLAWHGSARELSFRDALISRKAFSPNRRITAMIEFVILGLIVAAIVGTVTVVGPGEAIGALGRIVLLAAVVLFVISAAVGVARNRVKV